VQPACRQAGCTPYALAAVRGTSRSGSTA